MKIRLCLLASLSLAACKTPCEALREDYLAPLARLRPELTEPGETEVSCSAKDRLIRFGRGAFEHAAARFSERRTSDNHFGISDRTIGISFGSPDSIAPSRAATRPRRAPPRAP